VDLAKSQQFQAESIPHAERFSALLSQAVTMIQSGQAEEAIKLYRSGATMLKEFEDRWDADIRSGDPSFAAWWNSYVLDNRATLLSSEALALRWMGKLDEAGALYEQALELTPAAGAQHAHLTSGLGGIRYQQQQYAEAEELCRRAHAEFAAVAVSITDTEPENVSFYWSQAAQSLSDTAYAALGRGDLANFEKTLDEAIACAGEHDLVELADKFWLKQAGFLLGVDASGETIQRVNSERRERCARSKDPEFQFEARLLIAEYYRERGELERTRKELEKARAFAPSHRKWSLLRQLADIAESQGDSRATLDYSEEALNTARQVGFPDAVTASLRSLVGLHAAENPAEAERYLTELRATGVKDEIKNALVARAVSHCTQKRFDLALRDIDEAEQLMPEDSGVLLARVGAFHGMGDKEESLRVIERAVAAFRKQIQLSGPDWKPGVDSLGALHEAAAFLAAELGRAGEAFRWAESGKALRLRSRLNSLTDASKPADISFADLRTRLRAESAALLFFCVTKRGTLALLCDPDFDDPKPFFLDLTEPELAKLFPADRQSTHWNEAIFESLEPLSKKLASCFKEVIGNGKRRLIYIVPDSHLYFFPFAALDVGDGSRLVDHCAVSHLPCAAMLVSHPPREDQVKTCLALAGPEKAFSLSEHALQITTLPWEGSQCLEAATTGDFLEKATEFRVLHFACHGQMEASSPGTRSASMLVLHDRSLSAKDVYGLSLEDKLVFMNACVSGRFQSRLSNEVGGFWEAFLHAGASAIIATVAYVDPDSAQRLALGFYRHWLTGCGSAEALRQSQLELRRERPEPSDWATHILIGGG
jgi:tetratricopeptide (TPR) repeat protein